jgi:hypothetical protein
LRTPVSTNDCWTSPIIFIANSVEKMHGVLGLVLLEDVGLHRAAHRRSVSA